MSTACRYISTARYDRGRLRRHYGAHADLDTTSRFDGSPAGQTAYGAAFDVWAAATTLIHDARIHDTDPADLTCPDRKSVV